MLYFSRPNNLFSCSTEEHFIDLDELFINEVLSSLLRNFTSENLYPKTRTIKIRKIGNLFPKGNTGCPGELVSVCGLSLVNVLIKQKDWCIEKVVKEFFPNISSVVFKTSL